MTLEQGYRFCDLMEKRGYTFKKTISSSLYQFLRKNYYYKKRALKVVTLNLSEKSTTYRNQEWIDFYMQSYYLFCQDVRLELKNDSPLSEDKIVL